MKQETDSDASLLTGRNSKLSCVVIGGVVLLAVLAMIMVIMITKEPTSATGSLPVEYVVKERIYPLQSGEFVKLAFAIVIDQDKLSDAQQVLEVEEPAALYEGISTLLIGKTSQEVMSGPSAEAAFVKQLQGMLETQVFASYNSRQNSSAAKIHIREVRLTEFSLQD